MPQPRRSQHASLWRQRAKDPDEAPLIRGRRWGYSAELATAHCGTIALFCADWTKGVPRWANRALNVD
jgi:hypothetical protein